MTIIMLKLNNFQDVICEIDEEKISMEDILNLDFEKIHIASPMYVAGFEQKEYEGQTYPIPNLQPLNTFAESIEDEFILDRQSILFTHTGNPGIRNLYNQILAELTGSVVSPPEKSIVMP